MDGLVLKIHRGQTDSSLYMRNVFGALFINILSASEPLNLIVYLFKYSIFLALPLSHTTLPFLYGWQVLKWVFCSPARKDHPMLPYTCFV